MLGISGDETGKMASNLGRTLHYRLGLELYSLGDEDFWKYDHICVLGSLF